MTLMQAESQDDMLEAYVGFKVWDLLRGLVCSAFPPVSALHDLCRCVLHNGCGRTCSGYGPSSGRNPLGVSGAPTPKGAPVGASAEFMYPSASRLTYTGRTSAPASAEGAGAPTNTGAGTPTYTGAGTPAKTVSGASANAGAGAGALALLRAACMQSSTSDIRRQDYR